MKKEQKLWKIGHQMLRDDVDSSLVDAAFNVIDDSPILENFIMQWYQAHCQEQASKKIKEDIVKEVQKYVNWKLIRMLFPEREGNEDL